MTELIGLLFNIVTVAYLIGWIGYVAGAVFRRMRVLGLLAEVLLWLTVAVHILALILLWTRVELAPLTNKYQFLIFFGAAVGLGSAVLIAVTRWRILAVFTVPFSFLAMAYASWSPFVSDRIAPMMPALKSFWLIAHVITSFLGYAGFAVACGLALAYLWRWSRAHLPRWYDWLIGCLLLASATAVWLGFDWQGEYWRWVGVHLTFPCEFTLQLVRLLPRTESLPLALMAFTAVPLAVLILGVIFRQKTEQTSRLPEVEALTHYMYQFMVFGLILFTAGIATGAIWATKAWSRPWGWDNKETWSLITWFVYVLFPHLSRLKGFRGSYLAWVAIVGFFCVLFTWFVVNQLGGIHAYGV